MHRDVWSQRGRVGDTLKSSYSLEFTVAYQQFVSSADVEYTLEAGIASSQELSNYIDCLP